MRLTRAQRAQRGAKNRAAAQERREGTCGAFKRDMARIERERYAERALQQISNKLGRPIPDLAPGRMGLGTVVTTLAVLVGEDEGLQRAVGLEDGVEGLIEKIASGDFPPPLELPYTPEDEKEG